MSDVNTSAASEAPAKGSSATLTRLEQEGEIAADYLEGLLDIADLDGDIDMDVEGERASVSIIGDGRLLASGSVDSLIGESRARTRVEVADAARASEVLEAAGFTVAAGDGALVVSGHDHPDGIAKTLADADLYVTDLTAIRPDLESYFLELTGRPIPHQTEGDE